MRLIILSFLLILISSNLWAQNLWALPEIINYSKNSYGAGTQNWDIEQDKSGILYFANNEGLLSFDGTYWKNHPLPNKTIVRAVKIAGDQRIYVGGQGEIGFFSGNSIGSFQFTSLNLLIPEKFRSYADIWDIVEYQDELFFRSQKYIFQYSNQFMKVYPATSSWDFLGSDHGRLIAQDNQQGLLVYSNNSWKKMVGKEELPPDFLATSMTPYAQDSSLVTTWNGSLYTLNQNKLTPSKTEIRSKDESRVVSNATRIDDKSFALATNTGGCLIIDEDGKVVHRFTRNSGLQNNNVINVFRDRDNNLWLALENGIDFIAYNNAVKHINPLIFDEASGYCSLVHDNVLYIGLSNGLFKMPLKEPGDLSTVEGEFERVPNTGGQIWGMNEINNELLIGKHEGAYVIKNNRAEPVQTSSGFWTFLPFSKTDPSGKIIAGNYKGISLLEYENNRFVEKNTISEFTESARFLLVDNSEILWSSHPYRGVYKIEPAHDGSAKISLYTSEHGLPSTLNNFVFEIKNRIVVGTEKGLYEYDATKNRFHPSQYFRPFFKDLGLRYLREDASGNIWFIHEKNLGVLDFSSKLPQVIYLPELNGKMVSGFEHVYPLNAHNIFVGAEKGFYHINYEKYKSNVHSLSVMIRSVQASGKSDSLMFGGYATRKENAGSEGAEIVPTIRFSQNSLHFEYSAAVYEQQQNVQYSYFLEGFDKSWSEWSKRTEKDYTNLPAGEFTFHVKARNNLGNESESKRYRFIIRPPWYRSPVSYFIYTLLLLLAIYSLYRIQQRRLMFQREQHLEEQRRLQYLHQLEMEKTEKELVQLRNEKLESEIDYKNSELASTAMHLVQKGELLTKIKTELVRLNKGSQNKETGEDIKKILRILGEEERMDEDWQQFAVHFDKVHSDFLVAMKNAYPNLSANELKLCAYLRMNLSSKEIAQLLNISVRGIEISRYRLRKKLQIPTETNLFQFLLNFHSLKKNFVDPNVSNQSENKTNGINHPPKPKTEKGD